MSATTSRQTCDYASSREVAPIETFPPERRASSLKVGRASEGITAVGGLETSKNNGNTLNSEKSETLCPSRPDWYFLNSETGERLPFYCKQWRCPVCGPKRSKRAARRISEVIVSQFYEQGIRTIYFLTTTLDPSRIRGDSIEYYRDYWKKLLVYIRRWAQGHNVAGKRGRQPFPHHPPEKFEFIKAVGVQSKTKNPHPHLIETVRITKSRLKRISWAIGGGFEVDVQSVDLNDLGGAANKVARYVASQNIVVAAYAANNIDSESYHSADLPRNFRRLSTSRTIKLFAKVSHSSTWSLIGPAAKRKQLTLTRSQMIEMEISLRVPKLWSMPPPDLIGESYDTKQKILAHPAEMASIPPRQSYRG